MFEYTANARTPNSLPPNVLSRQLTFADLFAGIGGFHMALHKVGARCVFASEKDVFARNTYQHNFEKIAPDLFHEGRFAGDISKVDMNEIPAFDILCAGFPCQPFSVSGHRRGFGDPRGNVFSFIKSTIDRVRPQAYILENVPNLIYHDRGRTIDRIRAVLEEELGYSFHLQILRADEFNLPQYRPRTFIVGFRDNNIRFSFPAPVALTKTMSDVFGEICDREVGFTLRVGGRRSPINDRRNWDGYMVGGHERRLTPNEAKVMMGFPEWFEFPVSAQGAMKQLGNAVAVPVAEAVATEVVRCLRGSNKVRRQSD